MLALGLFIVLGLEAGLATASSVRSNLTSCIDKLNYELSRVSINHWNSLPGTNRTAEEPSPGLFLTKPALHETSRISSLPTVSALTGRWNARNS